MAEVVSSCGCPGCDQIGTSFCASCGSVKYCSRTCQTNDWPRHKEECIGHLCKLGAAHLEKAEGFERDQNWMQSLRYSELALTKLKKLKARSLEVIKILDNALRIKGNALTFLGQYKEALECAKERYSMWAAGYMRHYGMLNAAGPLIDALLSNGEYEQAALIARTAYEMIINDTDNIIPEDKRQEFIAGGARHLAQATLGLAQCGGIAPDQKEKAGEEAIALARKALEIDTQLHSHQVAIDMGILADLLKRFNGVDDDEIFRLYEQAIATYSRVQGSSSLNVAVCEYNSALTYGSRAADAEKANDLNRQVVNLELSLTHFREAERIYRAINRLEDAVKPAHYIAIIEEELRSVRAHLVASAATRI